MVTHAENELMTRIDGDAPMGRLMREHCWIPFALSSNLVHADGPMPVRLLGVQYVAFRAEDGRVAEVKAELRIVNVPDGGGR